MIREISSGAIGRRRFLVGAGAASLATAALSSSAARAQVKTSARIVIIGAGAAGLATASRLSQRLNGAKITIIDPRKAHFYQPGYTLIAAGLKSADYSISQTADYIPYGVDWVEEAAAEIDPVGNKVVTSSGRAIAYDWLVVASGMQLDYGAIAGMDTALIGKDGIGSVYASAEAAAATYAEMARFAEKGGVGLFGRPATEMKCAGAPLKYTFITDDILRRRGTRSKAELMYLAPQKALFSVPIVAEKLRMLFNDRKVKVSYDHNMIAIDPGKKIATYKTPTGTTEVKYDFCAVVPPMKAPAVIKNSPLPWQTGAWGDEGWMEVDKASLRHKRFANVFGVGDIAGVPKGKTAASVKWQVPAMVDHLVASIEGKTSSEVYNGYTSCPLITRIGEAMLVEFDYDNNLVPSFPGVIAPLEELWITWVVKTVALKPTYLAMLRGQA